MHRVPTVTAQQRKVALQLAAAYADNIAYAVGAGAHCKLLGATAAWHDLGLYDQTHLARALARAAGLSSH